MNMVTLIVIFIVMVMVNVIVLIIISCGGEITSIGFVVGILLGAAIVKQFSLKSTCKKSALVVFITATLDTACSFIILIPACRSAHIAGISASYFNR